MICTCFRSSNLKGVVDITSVPGFVSTSYSHLVRSVSSVDTHDLSMSDQLQADDDLSDVRACAIFINQEQTDVTYAAICINHTLHQDFSNTNPSIRHGLGRCWPLHTPEYMSASIA